MNFYVTIPNRGPSQDELELLLALKRGGAVVSYEKPREKTTTVTEFAEKNGMPKTSISRLFRHPSCPEIKGRIGPTGRVIRFVPTPELTHFLLEHKKA